MDNTEEYGGYGIHHDTCIIAHTLHAYVDRCMKTKDVGYHGKRP